MKVKLRTQYCGPRGSFPPGHVIDVPAEEAAGLIDGGYAVSVQAERRETAAFQKPAVEAPEKKAARKTSSPVKKKKRKK